MFAKKNQKTKNPEITSHSGEHPEYLEKHTNLVCLLILYNFNFIKKDEILLAVFAKLDLDS